MATRFQVTIDCTQPAVLSSFWATALHYELEPPPGGFTDWDTYWRSVGVPEDELDDGGTSIVDPTGVGPRVWLPRVPEGKVGKNRLHLDLDITAGRSVPLPERTAQIDAEAARLVVAGATRLRVLSEPGQDFYAVTMQDPEGNEFCLR